MSFCLMLNNKNIAWWEFQYVKRILLRVILIYNLQCWASRNSNLTDHQIHILKGLRYY